MNARERERGKKLYARGFSLRAVGAKMSIGHEQIRQMLIGEGVELRTANYKSAEKKGRDFEILEGVRGGHSYEELSKKHGVSKQRIGQIWKEAETRGEV